MKILKMFTRNELIELFKGVVYYTQDPRTFYNIALVCKDFSKICRVYNPMKKNEFRIEREYTQSLDKGYFLPNGARHEIIFSPNSYNTYNTGIRISEIFYGRGYRNDYAFMEFYKNKKLYVFHNLHVFLRIDIGGDKRVYLWNCILCNKIHEFSVYRISEGVSYRICFDCVTKKYYIDKNESCYRYYGTTIDKIRTRASLISAVIKYAKSIEMKVI